MATHTTSLRKVALWLNFRVYKIKAYRESIKKILYECTLTYILLIKFSYFIANFSGSDAL